MTTISSSLPSIRLLTGFAALAFPFSMENSAHEQLKSLQNLSTRISLAVLAMGFNLLGLLALLTGDRKI